MKGNLNQICVNFSQKLGLHKFFTGYLAHVPGLSIWFSFVSIVVTMTYRVSKMFMDTLEEPMYVLMMHVILVVYSSYEVINFFGKLDGHMVFIFIYDTYIYFLKSIADK